MGFYFSNLNPRSYKIIFQNPMQIRKPNIIEITIPHTFISLSPYVIKLKD